MMFLHVIASLIFMVGAEEAPTLSLAQVKAYAVNHNFGIKGEAAAVDEAKAQAQFQRSTFLPKLSLVAGPEIQRDPTQNNTETLAFVEGSWNLFRGAGDKLRVELADLNSKISESNLKKAQFELELEVEELFFRHLNKSAALSAYEESLTLNDKHRGLIRKRKQSGLASDADAMEFELRNSYLQSEMNVIRQDREEARIGLTRLMGPKIGRFEPTGNLPHVHLKLPLERFLSEINSTSEIVKAASLRSASGSIGLKAARAEWFPELNLAARYGKLPQELDLQNPAFQGSLLLKWEIFSGMATSSRVSEMKARASRLDSEFRQRLVTAMAEAEVSYTRLMSLQERVHVEERNVENAGKYYRSVLQEYGRGIKNGADLRVAEDMLLQARTRGTEFKYRFLADKIQLERAVGLFIETQEHTKVN